MSPTMIIVLIVVIGLSLLTLAALADRRARLRVTGPTPKPASPDKSNRTGTGEPGAQPKYVTLEQLERAAPKRMRLDAGQSTSLDAQLAGTRTKRIGTALLADCFATHEPARSIVDTPLVLVCAEPVLVEREVIAPLRVAASQHRALTIAAPSFDTSSQQLLAANFAANTVLVQVLAGPQSALADLAAATGCTWVERADLQADYLPPQYWGSAQRIVSDADSTAVIAGRPSRET